MGEELSRNSEINRRGQDNSTEWDELKNVPFGDNEVQTHSRSEKGVVHEIDENLWARDKNGTSVECVVSTGLRDLRLRVDYMTRHLNDPDSKYKYFYGDRGIRLEVTPENLDKAICQLDVFTEMTNMLETSGKEELNDEDVYDIFARIQKKYSDWGQRIRGERGEEYRKQASAAEYFKDIGYANVRKETEGFHRYQQQQEKEQIEEAAPQELLNKPLNPDAIIEGGDAELQKKQEVIDRLRNGAWAPNQTELAEKKIAQAEAEYRRAKKLWMAERQIWSDFTNSWKNEWSREEVANSLVGHRELYVRSTGVSDEPSRIDLMQAYARIKNRLERIDANWEGDQKIDQVDEQWLKQAVRKRIDKRAEKVESKGV